jgi:hypothetical protein
MCNCPWNGPVWDRISNRKHKTSSKRNWERSNTKAWTAGKNEAAQFDPNIPEEDLSKWLIESVNADPNSNFHFGTPIRSVCHKRTFYRKMGGTVGACNGEFTEYIYVEYHNSGLVHGWPISESELERKLAP